MNRSLVGAMSALALVAGWAPGVAAQDGPGGYLDPETRATIGHAVPPAPEPDSAVAIDDQAASERLRALENTDRWLLATRHAELRPGVGLSHFDCALGVRTTAAASPRLTAMLARILRDADAAAEHAKARAHRSRPVAAEPGRPSCQVLTEAGRNSPSYPSGSAAVGAAYAAALADVAPESADAVREIGRQIGVSRLVCGMHYPSDVDAGAALGEATYAAIRLSPGFQADLEPARLELAALRREGSTNPGCAAERAALAIPLP